MVQILLIGIGILILIKGNLKVSDTKEIVRPQSIYWGLIVIAYGIAVSFLKKLAVTKLIKVLISVSVILSPKYSNSNMLSIYGK
ncbi:MAG: hypothetical protein A3C04_03360 [Candidatus Wildermuthbacteria bacterium RIFCSPHIGHO2_02_FULL_45_25]|uniref:Uncharacterized protein n=1 Tax=Candidatus Wildermuthbacteria bacterium RIFCSPHIGHO2_02_FULL_45_25 TaxID=1802450 RepID=A0A1G2R1X6_9BACT|nr:MAG: hypothetical protein A3C04_03360 [Candidatus Wildermuthbacteria bacterium RIFCSPHIGHO2_02_FULL_45_25]